MDAWIEPTEQSPECRRWDVPGGPIEALVEPGALRLRAPHRPDHLVPASAEVRVYLTLGDDEVVARLPEPFLLRPRVRTNLWLSWPLAAKVLVDDTELMQVRRGQRLTMLGPVDAGRLLPGVPVTLLDRPSDAPPDCAALQLSLVSEAVTPVEVRRVAFREAALSLVRRGDVLLAGELWLIARGDDRLESRCLRMSTAAGEELVRPGDAYADTGRGLKWWLDGTMRSIGVAR